MSVFQVCLHVCYECVANVSLVRCECVASGFAVRHICYVSLPLYRMPFLLDPAMKSLDLYLSLCVWCLFVYYLLDLPYRYVSGVVNVWVFCFQFVLVS